ncbi:uncharacterized protein TM35_000242210 [Trypanosoma theileri]|uniref:Uncharacterized protein n=1 Tax=Trypanosoma theileri TaxID=67003 RepID=A0A1X0NR42_9TRYP|nr:uncharacterized protein TM35_000242210 [Trypanosoma theileri]ORC87071.1 hypothetical protein TM35_000242210 [Trypanosoma theileri]
METEMADVLSAVAAFRGTEEYAAAFDLEVWKAQQRARLREEMSEERREKEKVKKKEKSREELSELEGLRAELVALAGRLRRREEALQRRVAAFEAREAAADGRRVRVAEQHERHLLAVEARARRQLEEAAVQQEELRAQLRERERTVAHLEERRRAVESEYDSLQRCLARNLTEDEDKARVRVLEEQLATANAAVMKLQLRLKERESELMSVQKERDQLVETSKLYKDQLTQLTQRYGELQEQWHSREQALLEEERRRLEEDKRRHQLASFHLGNEGRTVHRYELLSQQAAENLVTKATREISLTPTGYKDDYRTLLKELQSEVAKELGDMNTKGNKVTTKPKQRLVYAEVNPQKDKGRTISRNIEDEARRRRKKGTATTRKREAIQQPMGNGAHEAVSIAISTDDITSPTLSSLSHREVDFRREPTEPYRSPLEERPLQHEVMEGDDEIDVSSSYCYAEIESCLTEEEERNVLPKNIVGSEGAVDQLPPLAPTGATSGATSVLDVSYDTKLQPPPPLPEDFVQASRALPPPPSRESTRAEMIAFVEKLRANKQKLLDSGVYSEGDTLLREMGEKIALYEDFLARHF